MLALSFILTAIIAYLLGSLNFSIIIVNAIAKFDIRTVGSGNAGTTNVLRAVGKGPAIVTLILDFVKAVVASGLTILWFYLCVGAKYQSDLVTYGLCVSSFFCVLGHMFPIYFKFKGGKGVATYAGSLIVIHPILVVIALAIFAIIIIASKMVSLGSLLGCSSYLIVLIVYTAILKSFNVAFGIEFAICALTVLIVFIKHRSNIVRIFQGKENKINFSKKKKEVFSTDETLKENNEIKINTKKLEKTDVRNNEEKK